MLPDGKFPVVTEHQTLRCVEQRSRSAGPEIQRIKKILEAGGVIQRLAPGVGPEKLQPVRETSLERELERIVCRVRNRVLGENAAKDGRAVGRAIGASDGVAVR